MFVPGAGTTPLEYLITSAFSFGAAVFSWLARRSGKQNRRSIENDVKPSLRVLEARTNGELLDKIRTAVREEVSHDELVRAVSEEAIRDYLDHLLLSRLAEDNGDPYPNILDNPRSITERRHPHDDEK